MAAGLPRALDLADRPDPRLGVFETLLAIDGEPQHLAAHLRRLGRSVAALYDAPLPDDAEALVRAAADHAISSASSRRVTAAPGRRVRVRLEARPLRRAGRPALTLSAQAVPVLAASPPSALIPYLLPGGLGEHKWLDRRLPDALGAALPPGTWPVLVDGDDVVLETHRANVWVVEGDQRTTPLADGRILPGVTRARLLDEPDSAEGEIDLARLEAADAVALSSAISLWTPVDG